MVIKHKKTDKYSQPNGVIMLSDISFVNIMSNNYNKKNILSIQSFGIIKILLQTKSIGI